MCLPFSEGSLSFICSGIPYEILVYSRLCLNVHFIWSVEQNKSKKKTGSPVSAQLKSPSPSPAVTLTEPNLELFL